MYVHINVYLYRHSVCVCMCLCEYVCAYVFVPIGCVQLTCIATGCGTGYVHVTYLDFNLAYRKPHTHAQTCRMHVYGIYTFRVCVCVYIYIYIYIHTYKDINIVGLPTIQSYH
jgi:hypothetical protein